MNPDVDYAYFRAKPTGRDTKMAVQVLLERNGKTFWVPRTVMAWHRDGILTVEQWFAKKEGMEE